MTHCAKLEILNIFETGISVEALKLCLFRPTFLPLLKSLQTSPHVAQQLYKFIIDDHNAVDKRWGNILTLEDGGN